MAYVKHVYASVQVAKIIAVTVVMCSVILGFFLLASAYITASASCKQLEQEIELLGEVADRFQPPLQPEALVQEAPQHMKPKTDALKADESQNSLKSIENNSISDDSNDSDDDDSNSEEENNEKTVHFKLPLQLDFDDLAGALIEKNQRSKMNCIVEKKRAEQLVDHQPKTVALPFGLNLTTDPRFERVTGERMAIFCESGTAQRATPSKNHEEENNDDDDDQDEETIMIQPVMIPIPQSHYASHMAQQMAPPQMIHQRMVPQQVIPQQMIPQEMVPPHIMGPRIIHQEMPHYQQQPQQIQVQEHIMVQPQHHPQQFRSFPPPPPPMETMRPPMPQPQMIQEQQSMNDFPPNNVLRHIAQQIIAQKIMEAQKEKEEQQNQEARQQPEPSSEERIIRFPGVENRRNLPGMTIPQAVLNELSRLSSNRDVIVAVAEQPNNEEQQPQVGQIVQEQGPQEIRVIQEPRTNPSQMNGRQTYARTMPIDIPEPMMKQEQEQDHEPEAQATEERPHFVYPRSVRAKRAVDTLLEKSSKRVKRCSCDCSC
ncbi:putative mediator of RNA polymerase II transcription subunit 26 isoform X2 [Harmonia axyridis]|uniref:putative mediator of RNA polymerase II transcription subunit 26 isoform X2 n=1 Tax=Harmonia axyridis TaxID=115357 RepID=UPI001E2797E0|nr:putative mediator of RNA polymerase II transcription subunit 26 isoform X2 [Harmonia axyridis]